MKHNHSCSCPHEEIKFCKVCKVVHCLGCNQEWATRGNYSTSPYWYGYNNGVTYRDSTAGGTLSHFKDLELMKSTQTSGNIQTASCSHSEK